MYNMGNYAPWVFSQIWFWFVPVSRHKDINDITTIWILIGGQGEGEVNLMALGEGVA